MYQKEINTEQKDCEILVEYMTMKRLLFSHIPSSTRTTNRAIKMKNKKMGVKRGLPDYIIIFPKICKLIFIEMKREKGGVVGPEQKIWQKSLNDCGIQSYICNGFNEARKVIDSFI